MENGPFSEMKIDELLMMYLFKMMIFQFAAQNYQRV
jgi:hypothetical protein